jgi:hypothetical protein
MAGRYFNGLVLLAEAARGADIPLAARVGEERERVVGTRDESLARLDQVEDLQVALGAEPVERPANAEAYPEWAADAFDAFRAAMAGDAPEAVAHLLGYVLGEAGATLDALAILSRLRDVAPEQPLLRLQGDSLERERAVGERRLARLAAHPLLPEAVQLATALAAHVVSEAAPSGSHAGRATRAEDAVRRIADQAAAIEAAL